MIRLAVDCMGGDRDPQVRLAACKNFLQACPGAELLLVGLADVVEPAAKQMDRATAVVATEVVGMDDPVEVALRKKKDSSMRVAINQVKPNELGESAASACVSAGNTGALMAVSRYVLKTLPGIDRPAIATTLPNIKGGFTTMLDLGANVDCEPEHLAQFALMGAALAGALFEKENPTVGLLNIGEEAIKGSETVKLAGELLKKCSEQGIIKFYGNVEGDDIFKGTTDVVVCDGFVGNVALKTTEGLAFMLAQMLKNEFYSGIYSYFVGALAQPILQSFKEKVDPRSYNGASLLGLRGLVFKSHGSADEYAFEQALHRAYAAANNNLLDRAKQRIDAGAHLLSSMSSSAKEEA